VGNALIVAKKEFQDLLNSKLVLIILFFYMLMLISSFVSIYMNGVNDPKGLILMEPGYDSCYFGSLVAVVLGFLSMSVETTGKSLNTLIVKPLYRDTIINGKVLGVLVFFTWIFWVTVAIYTLAIYLISGNSISPFIILYLERLPLVFLLYMLCSLLFYSLSMLMSILFKEQSFALFMGLLSWIILVYFLQDVVIVQNISDSLNLLLGGQYFSIVSILSPISRIRLILGDNVDNIGAWVSMDAFNCFVLLFYCLITMVLAYIAFLRRDVA